jgi:cold shock CspA family protein
MSEIAIFKWFGNSRNETDYNYKILECEDGQRFRIHHSEIHSAEELKRGQFITFDIEGNEAKKLRPLREVGVIDWYITDKGFGCAILVRNDLLSMFDSCQKGRAEIFVHISQVSSGSQEIKKGDIVVFDIKKAKHFDKKNQQNKYRDDALNLNLLSEESDPEIIDGCVNSDNIDVLLAVFGCSLNDCQSETAVKSIAQVLADCSPPDKISLISKLPEEIKEHEKIITFLSDEKKLEVWIKQLNNPENYESAIEQIAELLQGCADTKRSLLLSIVPGTAKQHPKIFGFLSNDEKLEFWVKELNNPEKYESAIEQIAELLQGCADTKRSLLLSIIPGTAKQHPNIFAFLSNDEKLEFWVKELNNPEKYEIAIEQIAELIQGCSENKRASVIGKIPLKAKQNPKIFAFLSDDEKIDFLVSQLQKPESYESAIDGIAKILDQYPQKPPKLNLNPSRQTTSQLNHYELLELLEYEMLDLLEDDEDDEIVGWGLGTTNKNKSDDSNKSYDDLLNLLKKLPDSAKNNEKLFKYLPPQEKIQILSGSLVNTLSKIEKVFSHSSLSGSERKALIFQLPDWVKAAPGLQKYQVKIPPVASRTDAAEAEQIRAFVAEREIKCLCHFTTIENLQGICQDGGLLSYSKLQDLNYDYQQIDEGRWDGKLNHICCSIQSYNSMYLYHAKSKSTLWVLLGIKPDYLWKEGTLFCRINAASERGAYIKKGFAGLKSMYDPVVIDIRGREYTREGLATAKPTCIQAEVQVHESISLDDVIVIGVPPGNEQKVRDAGWKGEIKNWSF